MYARVSFPVVNYGLAVPATALATRAGQTGVFTIASGVARFVPVETGSTYDGLVRVDGPGLRNARVAVDQLERLTDGASVVTAP